MDFQAPSSHSGLSGKIPFVGWTIFTAIDLILGAFLIDMLSTTAPPEKLPRLRKARNLALALFAVSVMILGVQVARRHGWI